MSNNRNFWIPIEPQRSSYFIDVVLNESGNQVEGKETITFVNRTAKPVAKLAFQSGLGGEHGLTVKIDNKLVETSPASVEVGAKRPMLLYLPEPILSGDKVEMDVDFRVLSTSNGAC